MNDPQIHNLISQFNNPQPIPLQTIWLDKLRRPYLLQNPQYLHLFNLLEIYSKQIHTISNDTYTNKVMVQLSHMLQTSLILSQQVRNKFFDQVFHWLQTEKSPFLSKWLNKNIQNLQTQQPIDKKSNIRPMSSINRTQINRVNLLRPMTAMYKTREVLQKQRPQSSKYTMASTKLQSSYYDKPTMQVRNFQADVENEKPLELIQKGISTIIIGDQSQKVGNIIYNTQEEEDRQCINQGIFEEESEIQDDQNMLKTEEILEINQQDPVKKQKLYIKSTNQVKGQEAKQKLTNPNPNIQTQDQKCFQQLNKKILIKQNKKIADQRQIKQIENYLKQYNRIKVRMAKQSSRKIQSAKLRPQSKKSYEIPNSFIINTQSTLNQYASQSNFMANRYFTSCNKLKKSKKKISTSNYNSCSLTKIASQVKTPYVYQNIIQPSKPEFINQYNQQGYDEILKIKKRLKKTSHIPTKTLTNALIINDSLPENKQYDLFKGYPSSYQLMSNPYLRKKKKTKKKKVKNTVKGASNI